MESTTEPSGFGDEVLLRLPAHAESLPIARTLAAAVASHWGATLDVVDDARLIVSELLTHIFQISPGSLAQVALAHDASNIQLTVHTDAPLPAPQPDSFGWLVVSELAGDVSVIADDSGLTITATLPTAGSTDDTGSR